MKIRKKVIYVIIAWLLFYFIRHLLRQDRHTAREHGNSLNEPMINVGLRDQTDMSTQGMNGGLGVHQMDQGTITSNKTAHVLNVQELRQRHLADVCGELGLRKPRDKPRSIVGRNVLFNDDRKYIYCVVGKVASSTWKQVLLIGTGKVKENRSQDIDWGQDGHRTIRFLPHLADASPGSITGRLDSYYKFLFVRHPLDRTLSAFRDKFRRQVNYMTRFGTRIIRRFRGANATAESLRRGHDVTLAEYIRFLLDPSMSRSTRAERTDIHWASQADLCQPCSIHYDFIGHYETLDDDGDYLVERLKLDPKAQFPHQYDAQGRLKKRQSVTDDDFREAFSDVSPSDMQLLKQLYAIDYKLFQYS